MEDRAAEVLKQAGQWLWNNREWVFARFAEIRRWLFPPKEARPTSGILVIGPGGVGKSTFARILSGEINYPLDIPGEYQESIPLERYALKDDPTVELIVPPGQQHRRDATWSDLEKTIGAGGYRGIIVTSSYGYHSLGLTSYKRHRLYQNDKAEFLDAFLRECRTDEINVLRRLAPFIQANSRKSWLLTLVTKQDLWWAECEAVESHYRSAEYGQLIEGLLQDAGKKILRHEFAFSSLVISNFSTGVGELLANTVAGYDQILQVQSLRRLWETVYALKEWEERT